MAKVIPATVKNAPGSVLNVGEQLFIDPAKPDQDIPGANVIDASTEQKRRRRLITRRHPQYKGTKSHWEFLEACYEGGRDWFASNIFRYMKEGEQEYNDRVTRAYRFNHSREVVDLLNKYLFKQIIARNDADAPKSVQAFWKKSTRNGLSIKDFSRQISKKASTYGRIGIVIDNTRVEGVVSVADQKRLGARTYAYIVAPEQLLDYAYDDQGELEWVLIKEIARDDSDPFESSGDEIDRYRLWTKTDWQLYEERPIKQGSKKTEVVLFDSGNHDLGLVPVVLADNIISDDLYVSPALIDDIAYLDRAVANYLSNLDAIIQDQSFSQLAMPAQGVLPGEDMYSKLVEMGTKRIFLYDGEAQSAPFYLSPDPKQANMVILVINKIINEIYHTVGLAGERTKQDNAVGIDNSSGVAKAYDFERVNALLAAKADSLEAVENRIAYIVAKWNGEDGGLDKLDAPVVSYPDNFDTRGLYDEFDIAARLMLIEAPDSVRQEQMKGVLDKLFPQLAKDLRAQMETDLKEWPVDPVEQAAAMAQAAQPPDDKQQLQRVTDRDQAKAVEGGN